MRKLANELICEVFDQSNITKFHICKFSNFQIFKFISCNLELFRLTGTLPKTFCMTKILIISTCLFLSLTALTAVAQTKDTTAARSKPEDQIRKYWFVMLLKGPTRDHDSATAANIQKEHLANINRLYNDGKIKVAGPFGDRGDWLGIFIFDCATKEEVETLLKTDKAVSSGRLAYDIRPWYTAPIGSFEPGKPKIQY